MAYTKRSKNKNKRTLRKKRGGMWPLDNQTQGQPQQTQQPQNNSNVLINDRITTEPNNINSKYKEIGIIHTTEAVGINFVRGFVTSISNTLGFKGVDVSRYDAARNNIIKKLLGLITQNQKICNLRMEIDNTPQSIYIHAYGTLLEKDIDNLVKDNQLKPVEKPIENLMKENQLITTPNNNIDTNTNTNTNIMTNKI